MRIFNFLNRNHPHLDWLVAILQQELVPVYNEWLQKSQGLLTGLMVNYAY